MEIEDRQKELAQLGASGMIKIKGSSLTLHPSRFNQMKAKHYQPWKSYRHHLLDMKIPNGFYWLIAKEGEDLIRVPFAKNELWFDALTSDMDWYFIRKLPQIYITGVG